jgi:hypothetical protein
MEKKGKDIEVNKKEETIHNEEVQKEQQEDTTRNRFKLLDNAY